MLLNSLDIKKRVSTQPLKRLILSAGAVIIYRRWWISDQLVCLKTFYLHRRICIFLMQRACSVDVWPVDMHVSLEYLENEPTVGWLSYLTFLLQTLTLNSEMEQTFHRITNKNQIAEEKIIFKPTIFSRKLQMCKEQNTHSEVRKYFRNLCRPLYLIFSAKPTVFSLLTFVLAFLLIFIFLEAKEKMFFYSNQDSYWWVRRFPFFDELWE